MKNFVFQSPTKIIFGRETEKSVGIEVKKYSSKILLVTGGGSIKKSGLYDSVINSLKENDIEFLEISGVKANPLLSLAEEGIKICRENKINFILAVGGGSVIDTAKGIAIGTPLKGKLWDLYLGKTTATEALPVGVVLTIPAAGSEASPSAVLTNEEGMIKKGLTNDLIKPVFSILNPELTFTLPAYQTAAGVCDIMGHLIERYFTNDLNVELTDRLIEATLKTVINNAPKVLENPNDYDARAEIMWAGTIAHNELLNTGRTGDWACHKIEHELSALYDIAHGAGLAIIYPAWMKYVYKHDINRFVQFAVRVWDVNKPFESLEDIALEGIKKMTEFFKKNGLPVTLADAELGTERIEEMANRCSESGTVTIGNFVKLNKQNIIDIYKLSSK